MNEATLDARFLPPISTVHVLTVEMLSDDNVTGSVRYTVRNGRAPQRYYGLAVSHMNRTFDWGKPWKVTGYSYET